MRWLVLACVLADTTTASAKHVVFEPPVVRMCQRAKTWDAAEACLRKLGSLSVLRTLPHARVVQIAHDQYQNTGIYLYVERNDAWQLGGMFEAQPNTFELMDAAPLVVGKHTGYRLDLGQIVPFWVQPDGITSVPATLSLHRIQLCSGDNWRCIDVIVDCEVRVHGATRWAFHGKMSIADNQVNVEGDRSIGGPSCAVTERQFLGWPTPQ